MYVFHESCVFLGSGFLWWSDYSSRGVLSGLVCLSVKYLQWGSRSPLNFRIMKTKVQAQT